MTNVVHKSTCQARPQSRLVRPREDHYAVGQRVISVMTLPDGAELFMCATHAGWAVFDSSAPRQSKGAQEPYGHTDTDDADARLLADIAEAYGFGVLRNSNRPVAPSLHRKPTGRAHLTLVSSNGRKAN